MGETLHIVSEICSIDKENNADDKWTKEAWDDMVKSGKITHVDEYICGDDETFYAHGIASDGYEIEVTWHISMGTVIEHIFIYEYSSPECFIIPEGFGFKKIYYEWYTGTDRP